MNTPAIPLEGTATDEQKEMVLLWYMATTDWFAGNISAKLKPTKLDIDMEGGIKHGVLVTDLTVDQDMVNGYQTMHGGCAAYLVDICTSVLLAPFSPGHVSLNLTVEYHQPILVGTTIEIVATTRAIGKRILSTKCEFYHKEKRTLLLSGTHVKMPPSTPSVAKL